MKTMTCKQLGGACEMEFHGSSFSEIAEQSKKHGMEMVQKGDQDHLRAMNEMRSLMQSPDAMKEWFESRKREFDSLPEDKYTSNAKAFLHKYSIDHPALDRVT